MARAQFSKDPVVDRALRHSVRDGMAYSVQVGAGETYFSAFALFLRATAPQVALISTLPPLLASSAQLLSAWAGNYFGRRRLVVWGCGLQALLWVPILLVPVLFQSHAVAALLALLALYYSANNLAAPQWTSIMRDLVSEKRRGRYFGYRTRLTTIATFLSLVACGVLLHELDTAGRTYFGFVLIFLIAFVARVISVYHVTFLHERPTHGAAPDMHIEHWWRSLQSTGAIGFSTYVALMNAAVGLASPFFTVYMLRDLKLSYLEFTALSGASVFVQFLMLGTWGRIADVYGNRLVLIVTSISLPVVPAVWILSDEFWALTLFQALSGLAWSGFTLATGNLLYELVPRTRRAAYVAFHNVGTAAGVFAGAMLGAALAELLPEGTVWLDAPKSRSNLLYLFVISGALRGLIAVLLARRVRELRKPRREITPHALVMRITGFNAALGVLYDFIGRPPGEPDERDDTGTQRVPEKPRSGDNTP
ncbi:MAG TPA: MFS transporter [Gammaproteobacteria bacterium]|jgi:MFS family permease|nr:MFS transporter [Gammaproteobacteria bacterium]